MLESQYLAQLIRKLRRMFRDCVILKNDTDYLQGIPDLTILYQNKWAMLEVKAYENAPERPNQQYYIELLDALSFASFIYPENETEVLYDLQRAFKPRRATRVS